MGLARVGDSLYGLTDDGELWRMNFGTGAPFGSRNVSAGLNGNASTIANSTTLIGNINALNATSGLTFTGLTRGPRNVEGGRFYNTLFAVDNAGRIFAFDTTGLFSPVFPGAASSVQQPTAGPAGLGTTIGVDFAALDVNLWHVTNNRANDTGHGRPATFDRSRPTAQAGGSSLYFGFRPANIGDGDGEIVGNWQGGAATAATPTTYNMAGGAQGAVESNPIDLSSYSAADKPILYFNYRLDTENANAPFDATTQAGRMVDSFRVYGLKPDGTSVLLATNNNNDDNDYNNALNENDPAVSGNVDAFGNPFKAQTLFDIGDAGAPASWRQARIPLASLAGLNDIRLRFEFSTGGSFESRDPLRGGFELKVVAGSKIQDRQIFNVTGADPVTGLPVTRTFEFDQGLVLNLPSGVSIRSGDQLVVQGQTFTFVTSKTPGVRNEILFSATQTRHRSRKPFSTN